ncbi:histidine phosphatase family protein [Carnobacterium maltaromaticum]|uniref:histidine phosphatase family protein n=1 Tax=Carnobacterium maltaromaticum TaxID=2751 RepID=UPI000C759B2A|nr:histidine phosphatase family protein [Carnobacterium maltaromaticum]PLS33120.1 histidine phosphatase family protein [Carnobacterium maltaromaticum]PLS33695.1 histidine phosphatase family protein [Carnobacterium maltaromaticum]PLS33931.1 histidine phosphatase family protein [Carnobacterium maltaromaticum]PLS41270.1 histidine phosphatase family protein [Carnobacterium maltaromaticum]PLS42276.1 histidine phosphatase family protein [Carnobacterium maltaromaticum]
MITTTLYFVRHGQTEWNLDERMQGHLNSDLTAHGIQQTLNLAKGLPDMGLTHCYTSDSPRTQQTTALLTGELTLPVKTEAGLREINTGPWEGENKTTIQSRYPESWTHFWHNPHLYQPNGNGETFVDLQTRSVQALNKIIHQHPGATILIVSHRITIKVMLAYLLNQPLAELWETGDIAPTSLNCVEITGGQATLVSASKV